MQDSNGNAHLLSADTASSGFSFEVEETGTYVLSLQPELYHAGTARATTQPATAPAAATE
jgi:hypothetical protein